MNKQGMIFKNRYFAVAFAVFMAFSACSEQKFIARKVKKEFKRSEIIDKYQVGFALYDIAKQATLYEKDAHKYFIPASNTKLFTFYGSLKMLPETLPALRYVERGDSLIFWGTGDPSLLQTELKGRAAYNFLKTTPKNIFFAPGRYTGNFYGSGWQWDDYNDYYQAEVNELPIMDNLLQVGVTPQGEIKGSPPLFDTLFVAEPPAGRNDFKVTRDFNANVFRYPVLVPPPRYQQRIPYKVSTQTTVDILSDTLQKQIGIVKMSLPAEAKVLYGLKRDSVLTEMMLPSDNFIAEQLLLLCADQLGTSLSTTKAIAHIQKNYLSALPDKPRWVDGSGLSRYNLFTPADITVLLHLIYKEFKDPDQLFKMLPAGGKTGTLKQTYPTTNTPFVYGKTGTISNNHNQSGYILTKKGKTLIYSFMNNNFMVPTSEVRKEMVRIITFIHENF